MKKLDKVLTLMGEKYKDEILSDSRFYRDISIGEEAENLGFADVKETYKDAYAVLPMRRPVSGMKVRIDGRTFVNYAQLDSGIAVPGNVAKNSELSRTSYLAKDSMILNFA